MHAKKRHFSRFTLPFYQGEICITIALNRDGLETSSERCIMNPAVRSIIRRRIANLIPLLSIEWNNIQKAKACEWLGVYDEILAWNCPDCHGDKVRPHPYKNHAFTNNALIKSKLQHSPWKTTGIWTLEYWIVQIPAPSGQNGVQMPYPIVGFVGQMPLLKSNCRKLQSSLIRLVFRRERRNKFKIESYFTLNSTFLTMMPVNLQRTQCAFHGKQFRTDRWNITEFPTLILL